MAKRVFLHVGTPKSGTTYLQSVLWHNVARLKADGLLLPGRFQTHYAAAKGVTNAAQRRHTRVRSEEAWPRLARQVNRWAGDALISHELLAPARSDQAADAKAAMSGAEVHLVLTARALHQQLPASWQEQVKGGRPTPYDSFLRQVAEEPEDAWFWQVQDIVDVARRWGDGVAPDRVHVVTVPPDRSDPSLLWRRYASVLGLAPEAYELTVPVKNVSLGPVESELLRRVHAVRDERFTDGTSQLWTRKLLATEILGQRVRQERIGLPEHSRSYLASRSSAMVRDVRAEGYHVVGDLEDLAWRPTNDRARSVTSVTPRELAEANAWTITRLREELASRRPPTPVPAVRVDGGVEGILELVEHIRAADTGSDPRPASGRSAGSALGRIRRSLPTPRGR